VAETRQLIKKTEARNENELPKNTVLTIVPDPSAHLDDHEITPARAKALLETKHWKALK
jgi:hypothetical protein